jgi:threonine synthase
MAGSSYLTHLECTACRASYSADQLLSVCTRCGKVLYARYNLAALRKELPRDQMTARHADPGAGPLWRWRELLPVRDERAITSLGEGGTPLLRAPALGDRLDLTNLLIKDESLNPTASFKARGMAVAVSRARELGARALAAPSAGNAAGALAAYAARAGLPAYVFMPRDAPEPNKVECAVAGARLHLVDGLIGDAGAIVRANAAQRGWFDVSTLREPYRAEGKKSLGLELAEQGGWRLPDVVIYPTGGGTGIVGMWKAFAELEELGWIGPARPRMVVVQATGCAPIVRAFEDGARHATPWEGATTLAAGMRVPSAIGDYLILDAVRQSGGTALAITDEEMVEACLLLGQTEGIFAAPEGGATVAAARALRAAGWLGREERVVLFNTGSGLKYPAPVAVAAPVLDPRDAEVGTKILP